MQDQMGLDELLWAEMGARLAVARDADMVRCLPAKQMV